MSKRNFDDGLWGEPSCKDEVAFATFEQAQQKVNEIQARRGEVVALYVCRHCQQWHLGDED